MTRLTLELLRARAEHHDGPLATLRALALHQLGLERIELINQACRHLTCLYLNNNIISRIENLNRLKARPGGRPVATRSNAPDPRSSALWLSTGTAAPEFGHQ